ncbi:hypothetical protein JVT61DRAFT_4078 [Boletus reticuloceps]|uniref:Uncharacterized protein n=1 Tax=Boletus reticuloceps TaxID=495285 RepID=A0A8I3A7I2_9AGAM|nr:hypothetical protein JVT61DRAFT_4078 [Boletus reticuloceps]
MRRKRLVFRYQSFPTLSLVGVCAGATLYTLSVVGACLCRVSVVCPWSNPWL